MLQRVRNRGAVQLLHGMQLSVDQKRIIWSKVGGIHAIRENVWILSFNHRNVAIGFNAQQLGTHVATINL